MRLISKVEIKLDRPDQRVTRHDTSVTLTMFNVIFTFIFNSLALLSKLFYRIVSYQIQSIHFNYCFLFEARPLSSRPPNPNHTTPFLRYFLPPPSVTPSHSLHFSFRARIVAEPSSLRFSSHRLASRRVTSHRLRAFQKPASSYIARSTHRPTTLSTPSIHPLSTSFIHLSQSVTPRCGIPSMHRYTTHI